MPKKASKPTTPKITFPRDGLIPAVAGIACAMAREGVFTSTQLSKWTHLVLASLMSSEFLRVEEIVRKGGRVHEVESKPDLYAEHFRLHGQSLKNLQAHWTKHNYWEEVSGSGKKTLYRISEKGLQAFMETVWNCSQGLEELRFDYILLSVYTIRTTPLSILKEVSPDLADQIESGKTGEMVWDWKVARENYVRELTMRKKSLEYRAEKNSQLAGALVLQKGALTAGALVSGSVLGLAASLPILGLMAFRNQRDPKWSDGPKLLMNLYQAWRKSYTENDINNGIEQRTTGLYLPMAENIGQMIRSLERLK